MVVDKEICVDFERCSDTHNSKTRLVTKNYGYAYVYGEIIVEPQGPHDKNTIVRAGVGGAGLALATFCSSQHRQSNQIYPMIRCELSVEFVLRLQKSTCCKTLSRLWVFVWQQP